MRNAFAPVVAAACVLLSAPASAFEKHSVRVGDSLADAWTGGATCRINYYNICTEWIWCWQGFGDDYRIGVVAESCCGPGEPAVLCQTTHFLCEIAPIGYEFVGSIAVHAVDANDCPVEPPIQSQPYLPGYGSFPFSVVNWGCVPVPSRFAIVMTLSEYGFPNPAQFGTDHPAAGPTGPQACGVCYPANRPNHSFRYGTKASPICPGLPFNDGVCDAQLYWDIDLACTVSVEESSWGKIKGLYR
jgi:hypothetical protein